MNTHGKLTSKAAESITAKMNKRGFDVYYDHGNPSNLFVGTIPVSIEKELSIKNQISRLDIAVVEKDTCKAIALIEIEETTNNPKKMMGDIFAVLMGNSIHLPRRKSTAKVGNWTTLIFISKGKKHPEKSEHIRKMANKAKSALGTENSRIGNVVIESFADNKIKLGEELEAVLLRQINEAIQRSA